MHLAAPHWTTLDGEEESITCRFSAPQSETCETERSRRDSFHLPSIRCCFFFSAFFNCQVRALSLCFIAFDRLDKILSPFVALASLSSAVNFCAAHSFDFESLIGAAERRLAARLTAVRHFRALESNFQEIIAFYSFSLLSFIVHRMQLHVHHVFPYNTQRRAPFTDTHTGAPHSHGRTAADALCTQHECTATFTRKIGPSTFL